MMLDPITVGVIGTLGVFLLLFLGMPIAFCLMLVGFAGISYLSSIGAPPQVSTALAPCTALVKRRG